MLALHTATTTSTWSGAFSTTTPRVGAPIDANGNLTADGTRTLEWDAENRLVAVNIGTKRSEFTYDGESRRSRVVEKENAATIRDSQLYWDGTEVIEERLSTGEVNRFFDDGEQRNGTARYLTRDHLGSVREVTESTGSIVVRNDYDPYGRLTRVQGTEHSVFGYTGHMMHTPSGLALALYRAYDSGLARWVAADPVGYEDGTNVYAYVGNRPIGFWDPYGLTCWPTKYPNRINSRWGAPRRNGPHNGADLYNELGDPVFSTDDGTVSDVYNKGDGGNQCLSTATP